MNTRADKIKDIVIKVLEKHGVKRAGFFGSVVRGEITEDSDIDLLVEIDRDISLLDFVGLKLEIEEVLGRKVDLVEYDTIKPLLREKILREQEIIL